MSKFNTAVKTGPTTTNLAGGSAYEMTPELELVSALLTTFLNDSFYEKGKTRQDRLVDLAKKVDPLFAAKAAVYARNEFGMRSASHVLAGEIADLAKGERWTKRFFDKIVYRPDDLTEIFAYYHTKYGKKSHAMWKGFNFALKRFDSYQLAKYRKEGQEVKLVDIINLARPHPTDAINALVNDTLRNTDTFEAKLSEAGKSKNENAKEVAWTELVRSGRIGYFALLKNLRNILVDAPDIVDQAVELLTDRNRIKKSLVLPFRYVTALEQIEQVSGVDYSKLRTIIVALNKALDISCENVPHFTGSTLVAVDTSGSMYGYGSDSAIKHAALFGSILAKSNNADLMVWGESAQYLHINPMDSTLTIAKSIEAMQKGGTNMSTVFQVASKPYDRVLVLTDEQSWLHNYYQSPKQALDSYKARSGANPMVYSWDVKGYGTLQFPEPMVATLAGWSEKVFDIMKLIETDKKALIHRIEQIEI